MYTKFTPREREDEERYAIARASGMLPPCRYCVVQNVVREYAHFLIMENDFPYTRIAKTSHMLSPKRHVSNVEDFTQAERDELHDIYTRINSGEGAYDQIIKNTEKNMTIPGHFHVHLIQFRDQ